MTLLFLPFFLVPVYAQDLGEAAGAELEANAVREALPEEIQEVGGTLDMSGRYDGLGALERLWRKLLENISERLRADAWEAVRLLVVVLFCSVSGSLIKEKRQQEILELSGCAVVSLLLAGGVDSMVKECFSSLVALNDYARVALPAVYTAAAAGGAVASASARYASACFALDLMMSAAEKLLLPVISALIAMSVCAAVFDNAMLRATINGAKKLAALMMSGMTIALTAMLSVTGLVSSAADAAAIRAAKTVISASLPIVGGIMANAASSVFAAADLVKNSAGAFGMVAVCALCLAPFAALAVRRFFFGVIAAAADMTASGRIARLFHDMSAVLTLLLGLLGSFALMLFFSVAAALRSVGTA